MQCFSIWYKGATGKAVTELDPTPIIKLHVNLWDFPLNEQRSYSGPSLDIGIEIQNFNNLDELKCYIPVPYESSCIEDLTPKLQQSNIADLIFNTYCTCISKEAFAILEKEKTQFLLCPVQVNESAVYETSITAELDMICITIHCNKISANPVYQGSNLSNLYCRFRVHSDNIPNLLFNKIRKNSDWFLVSGHIERKIVDLRINRERDIDSTLNKNLRGQHFELAKLKQVNFLIMEPVSNEITSTEGEDMASRIVETGWEEYLDCSEKVRQNLRNHNIMAYHWKQETGHHSYSKTVRITEYKSTLCMIIVYMLIILIIGVVGSLIASYCFQWLNTSSPAMMPSPTETPPSF